MKRLVCLVLLIATASIALAKPSKRPKGPAVPKAPNETVESVLQQAEEAWKQRDQPMQTESAIALWERAIDFKPERPEIYTALTKAAGRAYRNSQEEKEKMYWADEAKRYGLLAIGKNPKSAEAHAYYAEALGQWAQINKGVKSLKIVKEAVSQLKTSIDLQPKYWYAHMLLASFYENAPGFLSVGDKKKALEHARLAVEYGPEYTINHNTLAKILIARGKKAEAKAELEKSLAIKPPPDVIPETLADQQTAKELLKTL